MTITNGSARGRRRRFGFEPDGVTRRDDECKVVVDCSRRVIQIDGPSKTRTALRTLAVELRAGKIATVTGVPWTSQLLKHVLLRPVNQEIVGPDTYHRVRLILLDRTRTTAPGPAPQFLGTNIFRCGRCTPPGTTLAGFRTMEVRTSRKTYRCSRFDHVTINQPALDAHVVSYVLSRLSLPDVAELVTKLGLTGLSEPDVDVVAWWNTLPLVSQRDVVDNLMTVTVMPLAKGRKYRFDPARVIIEPKNKP